MMNELKKFQNENFGEIRTILKNGNVLFCGTDIAKALGYKNPNDAIIKHCKKGTSQITIHPQNSEKKIMMVFIPEGDVYRLIVKSKLPQAEKFESWVFDDILPSIRKNGGYIAEQEHLSDAELLAKALMVSQKIIQERENKIREMQPKAIFADAVSASHTSILVGELAKILKQNGVNIGQNRLFAELREQGYLIRRKGEDWNMPTQKAMNLGLFEIKQSVVTHIDGHTSVHRTVKVTGKGQIYFINKYIGKYIGGAEKWEN